MRAQYEDTVGTRSDSASTDTNGRAERSLPADDLAVVDGKLVTEAVEINSVWHCNINCAWCSHGSPALPRDFADELVVGRDLRALATWMTVDHVRVLGGEPLLHPRLPRLLQEIRSAQLSDRIRILTNGLMLARAEAAVWDLADEIHISVYPNTRRTIEAGLGSLKDRAAAANTTLMLKYFDRFRLAYRLPDGDHALTERIYRTCQIGNVWRCLTVERGHLYRCPQATFQHRFHKPAISAAGGDHLSIHEIGSAAQVRWWLRRGEPLAACRGCAGSGGELRVHRQLHPRERRELLRAESRPSQEGAGGIDFAYLAELETDANADSGCVSASKVIWQAGPTP